MCEVICCDLMMYKKLAIIILVFFVLLSVVFAEDVRVEGTASQDYQLIGGSGWKVVIDNVISGPPALLGSKVSVGMATVSPAIPKGTIDPNIAVGDRVEAYGALDVGYIKLYGSSGYYIKKATKNNITNAQAANAQITNSTLNKSGTSANGATIFDSCIGSSGGADAPEINLGEVYSSNFCPFSGGLMFQQVYRRFYVPSSGQLTAKMLKVPSNGVIMLWLQQVDDQSTLVSSPKIFDEQGNLVSQAFGQPVTLSSNVLKPAYWWIMIQCATKGGLQDSAYSFEVTQGCDWTGKWNLDSSPSNQKIQMNLQQSGDTVTGSYSNQGRITGAVSDNKLTGTWAEPPDYSPPRNEGAFEFTMASDCSSFSGNWGLGSGAEWLGQWNGKHIRGTTRGHDNSGGPGETEIKDWGPGVGQEIPPVAPPNPQPSPQPPIAPGNISVSDDG
jgi:hypothetical protein